VVDGQGRDEISRQIHIVPCPISAVIRLWTLNSSGPPRAAKTASIAVGFLGGTSGPRRGVDARGEVGGGRFYRLVLEDGQEIGTPRNSSDQSSDDHGDVLEGMYAPDMLDENGKPVLERAVMFDQGETCQREYSSLSTTD
jgi:hypothetical protein